MTASIRIDLNSDQDSNDEPLNVGNLEDGHFPALRSNCEIVTGHRTLISVLQSQCFLRSSDRNLK